MNKKDKKQEIKNLVILIVLSLIIGITFFVIYVTNSKQKYVTYNETSDVDYKVFLKKNDFYKESFLEKDKGYVASLIDSISTNFKYDLNFSKDLSYKYSYRIAVEVDVTDDKNDTNIYHFSEDLVTKKPISNKGNLSINDEINVKYGSYNNLISKFKDAYELRNVTSNLNLVLYVTVEDIEQSKATMKDKKVSSLVIPLTESTVSIDITDENITNTMKQIELVDENNYASIMTISLMSFIISFILIGYLIVYIRKSRTAQMIYEKEIKSILTNYDSYIQKINGSYDVGTSQVLKIETFNDMLEIRDTLKQPILMLENEYKTGTFFIIPATNSIIYTYALRVKDIKAKMEGKEIPTYDITEIPHTDFKKKKKYTNEYIKDQITMTTAMPVVDDRNIISNKNKENLYDQLEKTSSFDLREIRKANNKKNNNNNK